MDTENAKIYAKKVQLALNNLESVLGDDWDHDLSGFKMRITSKSEYPNLLDCLLFGAAQMKMLLKEGQRLCKAEKQISSGSSDCNLMVFGDWTMKRNYDNEVYDVLEHLGVNQLPKDIEIVKGKKNVSDSDEKVVLRVQFDCKTPVSKALRSAKHLIRYKRNHIAVSKDLSYEDRQKMKVAVKQLRVKIKEEPKLHWVIKDYQVINLGARRRCSTASTSDNDSSASDQTDNNTNSNTIYEPYPCEPIELETTTEDLPLHHPKKRTIEFDHKRKVFGTSSWSKNKPSVAVTRSRKIVAVDSSTNSDSD